jgi:cytochrome c556
MSSHNEAMNDLADMLYGGYRFDREEAIKLAREIEAASGSNLMRYFHPGAIATEGSRTTPAFWGNEATFKVNADALKAAARALAEELEKRPEKEKAVYPSQGRRYYPRWRDLESDPVSPEVWTKFKNVGSTCQSCHRGFRRPKW